MMMRSICPFSRRYIMSLELELGEKGISSTTERYWLKLTRLLSTSNRSPRVTRRAAL